MSTTKHWLVLLGCSLMALLALGFCTRAGFHEPGLAVLISGALGLLTEMAAVRLPTAGFFSTGFAVFLALAATGPEQLPWAGAILTLALVLRALARAARFNETLADLLPGIWGLAVLVPFETWQSRCLAGITVYYLLAESTRAWLLQGQNHRLNQSFHASLEWTSLYRWSILFLAPVLVCLHLVDPIYVLLALPMLAGIQRSAYSEMARFRLLDQEILLRKQAQSQLQLSEAQSQLEQTSRHLKFRQFSEQLLLELTRQLWSANDVKQTAKASLQTLGQHLRFRQLAIFVVDGQRLKPLYWMGDASTPHLPLVVEQQLLAGQLVGGGELSGWPLEREGALVVDLAGQVPLAPEEIYLVSLVANQTALGLQSARRFLEQQKTQSGALQASKMAAVGQLAAGVAHELNTPLGAVQLQLELLQMQSNFDPSLNKSLEVATKAVEHAKTIISRLLYYSREGASERQLVDLNQIVADTLKLLNHQLRLDGMQIETQLAESCPASVNPNEIQQVLINLVMNAKDACLEPKARGKKLLVKTSRRGNRALVEVFDQGAGIPEEIRERIFEPFFTSKPVGKGVGLGLSVSLELVQQHEGLLEVEPAAPPWSTVFRLSLAASP